MKLNQPLNKLYVLGLFFIGAFSVIFQSTEVSAEANYPEIPEATIFDGHVKASISYDKDHSPSYTAVGDTVTVTTTLEKLDDGVLPDKYRQSSVVILFPDETQGLQLKGEPTFQYNMAPYGWTTSGKFVDSTKELQTDVLLCFNIGKIIYYQDSNVTYDGRMTEIPIANELDDGPYEDDYALQKILIHKGDTVTLSYKAIVTEDALKNDKFTLHTAIYDSTLGEMGNGDFDWDHILTTSMPSIQNLGISFDEATKDKKIDIKDDSSYQTTLTGSWAGAKEDIHPVLTIDGKEVPIPDGSFKEDGTFEIPVDLKNVGNIGTNNVHIKISDSNGQVAEDDAVITLVQALVPPQIKLSDSLANATVNVFPTDQSLTINGEWKDKDSNTVTLFYKLNGQERVLQDNVSNTAKDSWLPFSQDISLTDLKLGDNQVEVYAKDAEGQLSNHESFKIILNQGKVSFKSIDPEIQFQNMVISGSTVYSSPQATVGVVVEDTTGITKDWQLKVKQTSSFSDGTRELPAQLTYLNGEEKLPITNSSAIELPVVQNNTTDYSLHQDANHQFQLAVLPGAYAGEYQSQLEWTIETAP
ncbi:hypothetical protein EGW67_11000 [Enterococcus faecium]|uniref:Uncharacterized protein n=1 Tax=Enterococcus faecium TaxID=1352 RepID=A0A3F3NRH3_ENTFC|nr:hypothetical protein [Enterococcus faecium]ELZ1276256.1 hypothetical protein [Enterococcus faecium]NTK77106.1 hypothetical protein [Enterococcus faecium]PQF88488.1 hypothetical protein CUS59_00285 [Enterococcus faecium]RBS35117.1 hypothetical protein EB12_00545 [Enterococcus faecium]RBS71693.1 hypothetical protein EB44_00538 [Enterococcus faecium]